jgi:hypothetical protein
MTMTMKELSRESKAGIQESDYANMVMDQWDRGRTDYSLFYSKVPRWYECYRGLYSGQYHAYRNNVSVPIAFSEMITGVAVMTNMTFGTWPYVQMYGSGPEDAAIARKNELLISYQMKDCRTYEKAAEMFLSASLYGTSVLQYGWKHEQGIRKIRVPVQPLSSFGGMTGEQIIEEPFDKFDGPDWYVLDILDCVPATNSRFIDEMDYFITRQFLDMDQIEAMGAAGYFNKTAVKRVKERGPSAGSSDEFKMRRSNARAAVPDELTSRSLSKYSKPVRITERWGRVPLDMAPDGIVDRVITIAEGKILLRNEPIPFWDGKKPFLSYSPIPDPHYFFAPSKIEVIEKLQYTANRLASQKLDIIDLIADPTIAFDKNRFTNKQELYIQAGRGIPVDGPPGEVLMPITHDLRGVSMVYQEIDMLREMTEWGTGVVRDTVAGGAISKRQTAREYQGRTDRSMSRFELEATLAEEQWIERLTMAFRGMNRQYLKVPREYKILGLDALRDPLTGQPLPPEFVPIGLADLAPDYDVRAAGASQQLNDQAVVQNILLFVQAFGQTPAAMTLNWQALAKGALKAMRFRNPDEITTPDPQTLMMQQMQMMGMQGGGGGGMSGAPSQMNAPGAPPQEIRPEKAVGG